MALFTRRTEPPATPQLVKSRFQEILDELDAAFRHMDHASHLAVTLVQDLEKGLRYIDRFRVDLTQALHDAGGAKDASVAKSAKIIEDEIAAYIPKKVSVERAPYDKTFKENVAAAKAS